MFNNKRYKDIFEQYIYKGEKTPISIGTLVVCALCFLFLIIATFTQLNVYSPSISTTSNTVLYSPIIPTMIFIIYLLGRGFSIFLFVLYLLLGLFVIPIFVFGGGITNISNYIFGYFLGFLAAILISGKILSNSNNVKSRLIAALTGVLAIHIVGFLYCIILAIFRAIDFNIIFPILHILTLNKILYDLFFSVIIILIAPYIKSFFWICMKPRMDRKK